MNPALKLCYEAADDIEDILGESGLAEKLREEVDLVVDRPEQRSAFSAIPPDHWVVLAAAIIQLFIVVREVFASPIRREDIKMSHDKRETLAQELNQEILNDSDIPEESKARLCYLVIKKCLTDSEAA